MGKDNRTRGPLQRSYSLFPLRFRVAKERISSTVFTDSRARGTVLSFRSSYRE